MITSKMKKVYYSPARGKHFLTLQGACNGEAWSLIHGKYPMNERTLVGNHECVDMEFSNYSKGDQGYHFDKLMDRLTRFIRWKYEQTEAKRLEGER